MADSLNTIDTVIGTNVKIFLMARGKSQTALGKKLGLQRSTMSNKIHGRTAWTAADVFETANFLNVPVQRLYDAGPARRFMSDFNPAF